MIAFYNPRHFRPALLARKSRRGRYRTPRYDSRYFLPPVLARKTSLPLIGQPQLLAQKAGFQMSGDEQIVARFMIEQLLFHGIRDAAEAATCLAGYDKTRYPEGSGPSFTGFFLPKGFAAGLRLERCGADLWNAFVRAHAHAQLNGSPEIQMDYFTRAIESLLAQGSGFDDSSLKLDESYWTRAVEESGYVGAQRSVVSALE